MDIEEVKKIYDEVFGKAGQYNRPQYLKFGLAYAEKINGRILEAGCGKGHHIRYLTNRGHDVYGIELSEVCCKNFLSDVPHECTDIVSHSKSGATYDGILCMGVMEHIPHEDVEKTLEALTTLSDSALFLIANHSDVFFGHELHVIQEDMEWWDVALSEFYDEVEVIAQFKRAFMFECRNRTRQPDPEVHSTDHYQSDPSDL
jgi:SAM-dependent methyltransferase